MEIDIRWIRKKKPKLILPIKPNHE